MKKVGVVGGISWVSTLDYYKLINQGVNNRLGGLNSAEIIIYSLNFADVQEKTWDGAYELLLNACIHLKRNKVDAIVLAANTAHLYADRLQMEMQIPIINIITETAKYIRKTGLTKVGLLGTKYTMQMPFYRDKLQTFGLEVSIPESQDTIDYIQYVVKEELGKAAVKPESRTKFIEIANELIKNGAEGLILGCTEIPMLINKDDFSIPVFDTTQIHAEAIVSYIVS